MSKPLQIIIKRKIDGPSVPELGTPTSVTFDSVTVPLTRASTGPAAIASYSIERATSSAGPWTVAATGALIFGNPPTQYVDGGRTALTTYYYRARATDTGGRVSGYSATVSVTTASVITPPPPPAATQFRNWPSMLGHWCQGPPYGGGADTSAGRQDLAQADIVVLFGSWRSAYADDYSYISAIKAIRPGVKIAPYIDPRFAYENNNNDGYTDWNYDVMQTVPNWTLRDASGNVLYADGAPRFATNLAVNQAGLDAQGRRLSQALANRLSYEYNLNYPREAIYRGIGLDDFLLFDTGTDANNNPVDADYDQNGSPDYRFDASVPNGGGHKWRTGLAQYCADLRAQWPGWFIWGNVDYGLPYAGGGPVVPVQNIEIAKVLDVQLIELAFQYRGRIGVSTTYPNSHRYPLGELAGSSEYWMTMAVNDLVSRTDAESVLGRKCYVHHDCVSVATGTAPEAIDYHFARLVKACTMSIEGCGYGVNYSNAKRPFWIDENAIEFGNPIGTRSMGTLNQNANGAFTFTLRPADRTGASGEKFFWTQYANALVLLRWDNVGFTPGSADLGAGSAIACQLPSAGAGYRWDEFNAATYVNPRFSDLAMRGQDTSWNSGATNVTTVSLKPYHAKFFRRVAL